MTKPLDAHTDSARSLHEILASAEDSAQGPLRSGAEPVAESPAMRRFARVAPRFGDERA